MTTTQLEKAIARCEREIADMDNTFEQRQDWKRHFVMLTSKGRYCTPQELAQRRLNPRKREGVAPLSQSTFTKVTTMQKLFMIQAFLQRYAELHPDNIDGKIGEEYIFDLWEDDILSVRMADEGYEYSWLRQSEGIWHALETVSELKELLSHA